MGIGNRIGALIVAMVMAASITTTTTALAQDTTELHVAARKGDVTQITALINAGADIEARTEIGTTPLHMAACGVFNDAVITTLLDAGADIKAQDEYSMSPLHEAARNGKVDAIIALLDAGVDPKLRNEDGKRPIDYIGENNAAYNSDAYWRLHDANFD